MPERLKFHMPGMSTGIGACGHRSNSSLEKSIGAAEQRTQCEHRRRHSFERSFGVIRESLVTDSRKSKFLKWHRGEVKHACASRLLFSIDMVNIFIWVRGNA